MLKRYVEKALDEESAARAAGRMISTAPRCGAASQTP
jgi:hypothetical protein